MARVIRNEPAFVLLDEQLVAFNAILDEVRAAGEGAGPVAFLIEGGPGTGKSVIAVNLVAELSAMGKRSIYATGSKAFTENLRKRVGTRASALFNYFREPGRCRSPSTSPSSTKRTASGGQHRPLHAAKDRNGKPQIDDILDAGRISVFFIDDRRSCAPARSAART